MKSFSKGGKSAGSRQTVTRAIAKVLTARLHTEGSTPSPTISKPLLITTYAIYSCINWSIWQYKYNGNNPRVFPLFSYIWLYLRIGKELANRCINDNN